MRNPWLLTQALSRTFMARPFARQDLKRPRDATVRETTLLNAESATITAFRQFATQPGSEQTTTVLGMEAMQGVPVPLTVARRDRAPQEIPRMALLASVMDQRLPSTVPPAMVLEAGITRAHE